MYLRSCLILAVCLASLPVAHAQPEAADSPAAEYAKRYREWKLIVAKLYQVKEQYTVDVTANKKALEDEYREILEKARTMLDPLVQSGLKAYAAKPNEDMELTEFLMANLRGYVVGDDFDKAANICRVLLDGKIDNKEMPLLAGVSFFATGDFDEAEKYLKEAKAQDFITSDAQHYLDLIPYYKKEGAKEKAIRAKEDKAKNLPRVKLTTTQGDIVLVLFENEAPIATANFISLVEKKFYDGLSFHRVIGSFMAQTGDPKGDSSGGPGYTIPCECYQDNHRIHFRGSLSMAHTGQRDTGGSQFFLTFLPTNTLDGKHTVFGRVVEGMDVLSKLQRIQPGEPGKPDKIIKATVLFKRNHPYVPIIKRDEAKTAATKRDETKRDEPSARCKVGRREDRREERREKGRREAVGSALG